VVTCKILHKSVWERFYRNVILTCDSRSLFLTYVQGVPHRNSAGKLNILTLIVVFLSLRV